MSNYSLTHGRGAVKRVLRLGHGRQWRRGAGGARRRRVGHPAAETLARWLDDRFLDPLLGLFVPGVGDVVGSVLGLYVVGVAWRRKLPLVTIARMLLNLGVDALVGAVPIAGDLFDFAWKANRRNVRLLRERHEARHDTAADWLRVIGAFALLVGRWRSPSPWPGGSSATSYRSFADSGWRPSHRDGARIDEAAR